MVRNISNFFKNIFNKIIEGRMKRAEAYVAEYKRFHRIND